MTRATPTYAFLLTHACALSESLLQRPRTLQNNTEETLTALPEKQEDGLDVTKLQL